MLSLCATITLSDAAVRGRGERGGCSGAIQSTVHSPTRSRAPEEREEAFGRPCMQTTPAENVGTRTTVSEDTAPCARGERGGRLFRRGQRAGDRPAFVHTTTTSKDVAVRTTMTEVGATCAKGARGVIRSDAVSAHVGDNHVRRRGCIHLLPVRQMNKR